MTECKTETIQYHALGTREGGRRGRHQHGRGRFAYGRIFRIFSPPSTYGFYEDQSPHPVPVMVGETDPKGRTRKQARDRGKALAGKSTLNRLELSTEGAAKHPTKKIGRDAAIDRLMVDVFLQDRRAPRQIILDLDATDDLIHESGGSFFHG